MAGDSARVRVTYPEKRGAVEAFLIHAKKKSVSQHTKRNRWSRRYQREALLLARGL